VSMCHDAVIVKAEKTHIRAVSLPCNSWFCVHCAIRRRRRVIAQAMDGAPTTFITLTVNPAFGFDPVDRAKHLVRAWRHVVRAAKARYGYKRIPYFAVFEKTKKGEPHLHILCRVKWIDQKWLSDQMDKLMSSPIVDIRKVERSGKAAYYVSKYLGKDPTPFGRLKRYWQTQDWQLYKPAPQERDEADKQGWVYLPQPLPALTSLYCADGYFIVRALPDEVWFQRTAPPSRGA